MIDDVLGLLVLAALSGLLAAANRGQPFTPSRCWGSWGMMMALTTLCTPPLLVWRLGRSAEGEPRKRRATS